MIRDHEARIVAILKEHADFRIEENGDRVDPSWTPPIQDTGCAPELFECDRTITAGGQTSTDGWSGVACDLEHAVVSANSQGFPVLISRADPTDGIGVGLWGVGSVLAGGV